MSAWPPHVTVATVVEKDGCYLLVEEIDNGKIVFNQPAGHLDPDESLTDAALRETLEETAWHVELTGVAGIALYTAPSNGVTYYRTTFIAKAVKHDSSLSLDEGIVRAVWMDYETILANRDKMRSPLVIKTIDQVRNGHNYPLTMVY